MILSGTGHRPDKLGGYVEPNPISTYVRSEICRVLKELAPTEVISGMALGFDIWLAEEALNLGIPLTAAVPMKGQESLWPEASRLRYRELIARASRVIVVSDGEYHPSMMQIRNRWMVDNSDTLLACYNGDRSGGTFNCIKYATEVGRTIVRIDPVKSRKIVRDRSTPENAAFWESAEAIAKLFDDLPPYKRVR